mmetsp:Transcript_38724/g.92974  ORF Transcript_38724/g.92974 Transcript_38724/m.92974 type:complete len:205 (+) Transcript_38724:110-724(+)
MQQNQKICFAHHCRTNSKNRRHVRCHKRMVQHPKSHTGELKTPTALLPEHGRQPPPSIGADTIVPRVLMPGLVSRPAWAMAPVRSELRATSTRLVANQKVAASRSTHPSGREFARLRSTISTDIPDRGMPFRRRLPVSPSSRCRLRPLLINAFWTFSKVSAMVVEASTAACTRLPRRTEAPKLASMMYDPGPRLAVARKQVASP